MVAPEGEVRHLYLTVKNTPRKCLFLRRRSAENCHGFMSVTTMDGQPVFKDMPLRWAGNPEPYKIELQKDGSLVGVPDISLLRDSRFMTIPPDGQECIDTVTRVKGEKPAYGWTDTSYIKGRRHPDYEIPTGIYIIRINLKHEDNRISQEFILNNLDPFEGLSLEVHNSSTISTTAALRFD